MSQQNDTPGAIEPSAFQPLGSADSQPPAPRNTRRWLLIACATIFTLLMIFLLSVRSLQVIIISETPARVSISGLALPFGDRYLLRPGDYTVNASAEGYHPLETSVTVDEQDNQTIELELQLLPGLITIESNPAGATVLIDGEPVGETPLQALPVEAGEHNVLLLAERYLPLEQPLSVTGRNIRQALALELAPAGPRLASTACHRVQPSWWTAKTWAPHRLYWSSWRVNGS